MWLAQIVCLRIVWKIETLSKTQHKSSSTGWQKYSGTHIMLTSKCELLLVYKVTTCLALRRKSHHQVNKICVPEYFCHPVCGVASRFCTAKPELLMSNSFLRSCWLCSRSISRFAANFASMESSGQNTFRSINQSFFSRFRCRVISKNLYLRWLKWLSPMIKIRRCSSCRGCGSISEFMNKQICEYYSTIGCFLITLLVKLTIMRFYDPPLWTALVEKNNAT